jgi:ankyrin repeat protein
MKKESIIYHTNQIMSDKIKKQNDVLNKLIYYTKDHNYYKFVEVFRRQLFYPETRNEEGMTLLSIAVQCDSGKIVKYLIDIGSEVNTQDVNFFYLEISQ